MDYRERLYDLIEHINGLNRIHFNFKGVFAIRERNYNNSNNIFINRRYPDELEISVMFIKTGIESLPIEVIKHTFVRIDKNEDHFYMIFYQDLLNFIIFSRSDNGNTYTDIRDEKVIIRSIGDWLIKNYKDENTN